MHKQLDDIGNLFVGRNKSQIKKIHPMDEFCLKEDIYHHKIRPRTPRHNGKVERSHRNDQKSFYFYEDLQKQMKTYLIRSNNIPMQILGWISPIQKRNQLEKQC